MKHSKIEIEWVIDFLAVESFTLNLNSYNQLTAHYRDYLIHITDMPSIKEMFIHNTPHAT